MAGRSWAKSIGQRRSASSNVLLRFRPSFRILSFRFAPPLYCTRRKHCANALSCGAGLCGGPSASSEAEGPLASSLEPYSAMRTQFPRCTVTASVLLLVAVVLPRQAQAQEYPIAEARAAYWEAAANAYELSARAWNAWALAGGKCAGETETCREWASKSREDAEEDRELAKYIRENPSLYNEPREGKTAQDEARIWRDIADEAEGGAALFWDQADQARQLVELGQNVRTWTRAAELKERVAEAYEEMAEAAYVVADAWDKRAGN